MLLVAQPVQGDPEVGGWRKQCLGKGKNVEVSDFTSHHLCRPYLLSLRNLNQIGACYIYLFIGGGPGPSKKGCQGTCDAITGRICKIGAAVLVLNSNAVYILCIRDQVF